jgi:hypothetical protein
VVNIFNPPADEHHDLKVAGNSVDAELASVDKCQSLIYIADAATKSRP